MGKRAGQGYGREKPKRQVCPDCGKKGVGLPKLISAGVIVGWFRSCQYCGGSWGDISWKLACDKMAQEVD